VGASGEPREVTTSWFAPDGSDWVLTFRLKRINGRTECVGMAIVSFTDREPLRAQTLRALRFASEFDRARHAEDDRRDRLIDLARRMGGRIPELEAATPLLASGKPRQRRSYTIKDYERAAAVYSGLCGAGSEAPTRDTAEALGLRPHQAAKLIERCRLKGYLPPTDPGVARGATDEKEEGTP